MRISKRQLRRIIREAYSYKDPYPSRRKQQGKQNWVIVCDWSQHPDKSKHGWGEQVFAEYFGTKRDAERKALEYAREENAPMYVEPTAEDQL